MSSTVVRPSLDEWSKLVDALAEEGNGSVAGDLPDDVYLEEAYLPAEAAAMMKEKDWAVQLLGGAEEVFEASSSTLFRPQMTMEESLRAVPTVTHFSCAASKAGNGAMVVRNSSEDDDDATSRERKKVKRGGSSGSTTSVVWDGPDLYSAYTTSLRAASNESLPPMRAAESSSSQLAAGFLNTQFCEAVERRPDFMPIIFVPPNATAPLQLLNIQRFLEEGVYTDPTELFIDPETGASRILEARPPFITVSAEAFKRGVNASVTFSHFRVVDNPQQVSDWNHVCAAIVNGQTWQFQDWYPAESRASCEPSRLFSRLSGFLAYFEEDVIPAAVAQWHVKPLLLTKRVMKDQQHILEAARFWESLFSFMDLSPQFNQFTIPL